VFDAIILAGGTARRLDGADKPAVELDGISLLDRAIAAARDAVHVVVVGPERTTEQAVQWAQEDPPGGGPVAAIAAGLAHIDEPWCLVLAADLPWIAPAIPMLLPAAAKAAVAVLTTAGRRNNLAAVWRTEALRAAVDGLDEVNGAAARELFVGLHVVEVSDEDDWGRDCDTWSDIEEAKSRASHE
jgi:molybdopterin-guanine dinucleotide biosynthesis protein A